MLGLFPFITMFIVTSITMLRERVTGTLERLMTMPLAKLDSWSAMARFRTARGRSSRRSSRCSRSALLDLDVEGSRVAVIALAVGNAMLGMALGLFASAFARTEFQAVQFMPAIVFPQVLPAGLFVAANGWRTGCEVISDAFPLTYAYDALSRVTEGRALGGPFALRPRGDDRSTLLGARARARRPSAGEPPSRSRSRW